MRGQVPALRRLHRQAPAGGQQRPQARDQLAVVGQPLDHRVAVEQRRRRVRPPVAEVAVLPAHPRGGGPRPFQHLRRVVHAGHRGARPALGQQPGHVAAAATEVVDVLRLHERDPPHQVQGGPQPVVGELQVLRRVPGAAGHGSRVRRGLAAVRHGLAARRGLTGVRHGLTGRRGLTAIRHGLTERRWLAGRCGLTTRRRGLTGVPRGLTGLRRVPGVAGHIRRVRRAFIPAAGSRGRARQMISRWSRSGSSGNGFVGRVWYQYATDAMSSCSGR